MNPDTRSSFTMLSKEMRAEEQPTHRSDKYTFTALSKNLGQRIRSNGGMAILAATSFYLVLRVLSIGLKGKLAPGSFVSLSVESLGNVLDNLFAGVLIAAVAYVLRDVIRDWLLEVRTVKTLHFNSLEDCLKLLAEAISTYKENVERAHVTTVAPLLFSRDYVQYYYDSDSRYVSGKLRQDKKDHCMEYLHRFQEVMDRIVAVSEGAYDKTLLGRTGIARIDRSTLQLVSNAFEIGSGGLPGTSELGFHSNLNEYGTFIFGQCHKSLESEPVKFDFMLLVQFDTTFQNLCGYICFDGETIKQNYEFLSFKIHNADRMIVSNNSKPIVAKEWSEFCTDLKRFFGGVD